MTRLLVALPYALFFTVFALTACGGGGGGTDSPTPTPAPTPAPDPDPEPSARFSSEVLEGAYVFSSIGFEPFEGVFHTIGHFTADGQGGISGQQENIEASGPVGPFAFEGSYTVDENGRGSVSLIANAEGVTVTTDLRIILVDENEGFLLDQENDQLFIGSFRRQTSSLDANRLDGTHIFSLVGNNQRVIGRIELNGSGSVIGGDQDVNQGGFVTTDVAVLSGNYQVNPLTGRTPFRVTSELGTSDFVVYPIDEDQALIMSTEPGLVAAGTVRRQTSGPISTTTLVGPHIVTSFGANLDGAVSSLGRVVLEADGTIGEGRITLNSRGGQLDDAPLTGTFAVNALGVGEAAVAYDGITENLRFRVIDEDNWTIMSAAPNQLTSGLSIRQLDQDYSNANFRGNYLFGFDQSSSDTLTFGGGDLDADGGGTFSASGSGSRFREGLDFSLTLLSFSGTYSTRADGRGTASWPGLSDQTRYYHVDDETILMIGADQNSTLSIGLTRRFVE